MALSMTASVLMSSMSVFDRYYRHGICRWLWVTGDVMQFHQSQHCFWLLDEMAFRLAILKRQYPDRFYLIKIETQSTQALQLSIEDGNGHIWKQWLITAQDWPEERMLLKWYAVENGENGHFILLFPHEY